MICAVILCHPSSAVLLDHNAIKSPLVRPVHISCGTTKVIGADYSESSDFSPSYATWNSALFETSVIMTVWEHADQLIKDNHVAILHTDIRHNHKPSALWRKLHSYLDAKPDRAVGLTIPTNMAYNYDKFSIAEVDAFTPRNDPMNLFPFDTGVFVWDIIRRLDYDAWQWAMDVNPPMIYSHQFVCSRSVFDYLGFKLYRVIKKLRLFDCGLWTPHVFERIIAVYLAQKELPLLTTAFVHHASSGPSGPGSQILYGPRGFKFYNTGSRALSKE